MTAAEEADLRAMQAYPHHRSEQAGFRMADDLPWEDALWRPGQRETTSRLLFIARLSNAARGAIEQALAPYKRADWLDEEMFAPGNWHQSLSDRYNDHPKVRRMLMSAGGMVRQRAFTLELDCIHCAPNPYGSFHWDVRTRRTKSEELAALITAINAAIAACGLPPGGGHSPHVTVHYRASGSLPRDEPIVPVLLTIGAIELVVGRGNPYRYETLHSWPLGPELPRPLQTTMF